MIADALIDLDCDGLTVGDVLVLATKEADESMVVLVEPVGEMETEDEMLGIDGRTEALTDIVTEVEGVAYISTAYAGVENMLCEIDTSATLKANRGVKVKKEAPITPAVPRQKLMAVGVTII